MKYIEQIIELIVNGYDIELTFKVDYYGHEENYNIWIGINQYGPFFADAEAYRYTDETPEKDTEELIPLLHILLYISEREKAKETIDKFLENEKNSELRIVKQEWDSKIYPSLFLSKNPTTTLDAPPKVTPTLEQIESLIQIFIDGLNSPKLMTASNVSYLIPTYPQYTPTPKQILDCTNLLNKLLQNLPNPKAQKTHHRGLKPPQP